MNLPKGFDDSLAIFVWLFMFGQPFQLIHVNSCEMHYHLIPKPERTF